MMSGDLPGRSCWVALGMKTEPTHRPVDGHHSPPIRASPYGERLGQWSRPRLLIEQAGALVLLFGNAGGLYAVGVGMMSSFIFMVTGAWLLVIGVRREEAAQASA
jgi:hypothetical protein